VEEDLKVSAISFLASSKIFKLPDEINTYNKRRVFERDEDFMAFYVQEIDEYWSNQIKDLFSLPYLYEVVGLGNQLFLTYLEKYMEMGDVLEIYSVPNQHALLRYKQKMLEYPRPIEVNVGNYTYKDVYGMYQLNPKTWVDELDRRNYSNQHGITTILNYS